MTQATPPRVSARAFLASMVLTAMVLLTLVLLPQYAARNARLGVLRMQVEQAARLTASHVDGELHRRLLDGSADAATLAAAREPLMRMHRNWPEARYVYTMGILDGRAHFILDTAQDAAFAQERDLIASPYMEPFEQRLAYRDNWLQRLAAGRTYVTPDFQEDDFGIFLSGHAPVFDLEGKVSGFVGVDFGLDYFLAQEARFRRIEIASGLFAMLLSVLLGYLFARRQVEQQAELHHHYRSSIQDSLTGLRNRRGALQAIEEAWSAEPEASHAALLVDVDNFKRINDAHGHHVGDAVLQALARALEECARPGDVTARLGGDEFLLFARGSDHAGAEEIARALLAAVRGAEAPVTFTVSVGFGAAIAVPGGFDVLYRQADAALYRAKNGGRNRYAVIDGGLRDEPA